MHVPNRGYVHAVRQIILAFMKILSFSSRANDQTDFKIILEKNFQKSLFIFFAFPPISFELRSKLHNFPHFKCEPSFYVNEEEFVVSFPPPFTIFPAPDSRKTRKKFLLLSLS